MNITVISTGRELLRGAVVNTNLAEMGRRLLANRMPVTRAILAGDGRRELLTAIADGVRETDILMISGGLGSTGDDLTRDAAAEFFGLELRRDAELSARLRRFYREHHPEGPVPKMLFRQADVPEGAEILPNTEGSAPGLYFRTCYGGREIRVFLLPGPPHELVPMFENEVLPRLADAAKGTLTRAFLAEGVGELEAETRLREAGCPGERACCAIPGGTRLFFTGSDPELDEAQAIAEKLFGNALTSAASPAEACIRRLRERKLKLALAESCTGGMISGMLTEIPGASEVLLGGVVSYSNDVKRDLLGVAPEILRDHGAVSEPCARAMAEGALARLHGDIAGAVTGIAGPGGGTPEKPVGLVWIAVSFRGKTFAEECHFKGSRDTIRHRTAAALLGLLRRVLKGEAEAPERMEGPAGPVF